MAEHVWSVICYRASIDQLTNNVSLLHVIEQLRFDETEEELIGELEEGEVRGIQSQMELVTLWSRSDYRVPEIGQSRVRLETPTGVTDSGENVTALNLTADFNFRVRMRIPAIPFVGFGAYFFVVELEEDQAWVTKARVPILLRQQRQPSPAPETVHAPAERTPRQRRSKPKKAVGRGGGRRPGR